MDLTNLNEMQTRDVLESIVSHIESNGWVHLFNEIDYVKHLEEKNAELLRDKEFREEIGKKIESAIQQIDKVTITLLRDVEGK